MSIVLASQSPRRQALLTQIGLPFRVVLPRGAEKADRSLPPFQLVQQLSRQKAEEIFPLAAPGELVLAADTLVVLDGAVMGKPRTPCEAREMLRLLSGRTHVVYTGICLIKDGRRVSETAETSVTFRPLSDGEIDAYVATGEPMDKAGAYGIQGKGALLVSGINGDFYTVMGLPLCRLGALLSEFGYAPFANGASEETEGLT
ncbi:MAG: Maf family protein [Oscillospiraceae bacterium]